MFQVGWERPMNAFKTLTQHQRVSIDDVTCLAVLRLLLVISGGKKTELHL